MERGIRSLIPAFSCGICKEACTTNRKDTTEIYIPLLYLRGEFEGGDMDEYVNGFRTMGISSVTSARIPDSGHVSPEENPETVWADMVKFIGV